jgi:hypothetical protein
MQRQNVILKMCKCFWDEALKWSRKHAPMGREQQFAQNGDFWTSISSMIPEKTLMCLLSKCSALPADQSSENSFLCYHSGIPESPLSKIRMPCKKLQDSASLVWKSVDVALDPAGDICLILGNFTTYTPMPQFAHWNKICTLGAFQQEPCHHCTCHRHLLAEFWVGGGCCTCVETWSTCSE